MTELALKRDGRFTYADYLTWSNGERWELVDGVAYAMTPAPNRVHQSIAGRAVSGGPPRAEG